MAGAGTAAAGVSALGLPANAAAAASSRGGSISIGLRSDVSRLDPHPLFPPYPTSNAVALLYNGITEVDANANIVPALAHAGRSRTTVLRGPGISARTSSSTAAGR